MPYPTTPNLGLPLIPDGDQAWGEAMRAAMEALDQAAVRSGSVAIVASSSSGTVQLPNLFQILSLTTTEPGRFRLYRDTASRDADLARPVTQEIEAGHGLLLEFVTVAGQLAWGLSPLAAGAPATPGAACAWAWDGPAGTTITLGIYQEA